MFLSLPTGFLLVQHWDVGLGLFADLTHICGWLTSLTKRSRGQETEALLQAWIC